LVLWEAIDFEIFSGGIGPSTNTFFGVLFFTLILFKVLLRLLRKTISKLKDYLVLAIPIVVGSKENFYISIL
jgi:type II secretory pathway component PulF